LSSEESGQIGHRDAFLQDIEVAWEQRKMVHSSALLGLFVITFLASPWVIAAQGQAEGSVVCHQNFGDDRLGIRVNEFASDIHSARGFGCVSYHGGDATDSGVTAMADKMREKSVTWPVFTEPEMGDLVAYLQNFGMVRQ